MIDTKKFKIILPGGAGLVGQNLVAQMKAKGWTNIVVLDKHSHNVAIMRRLHPEITIECVDTSIEGSWRRHFHQADVVVMLQAQIGGNSDLEFIANNINSTRLIIDCIKANHIPQLVHISSSVVRSSAIDDYTNTKKEQERIVLESGIAGPILRPTLMFGWFDRKHLGWLARFMKKVPIFPVPGNGRFMRQPLYAGDFSNVIISCIENNITSGIYNISGQERIDYIDIIRQIKKVTGSTTQIIKIPYRLFHGLLWVWERFDKNPPFTTQQLAALVAKDEFEVIDWPQIFKVPCTPFSQAIDETFNDPTFSKVVLEF